MIEKNWGSLKLEKLSNVHQYIFHIYVYPYYV